MARNLTVHSATSWRHLQSWDSLFSADSIEFCPLSPYQQVFLCGTYQLAQESESSQKSGSDKRQGTLLLFHLNEKEERFSLIRSVETAAILDIKWSHCRIREKIVFGIVNAIGQLVVYELLDLSTSDKALNLDIVELCSHQLDRGEASEILALSLDWSSRHLADSGGNTRCSTNNADESRPSDRIVVSDSRGSVHLFELSEVGLTLETSWKGHGFEAWISAFNYARPTTFYSGGDDCLMKVYDTRQSKPVHVIESHEAGVTSIQYNPYAEHSLSTGSYDEHVYTWDDRNMKSYHSKINLGGGVWRIKHQSESSLLSATMYNGFHLVQWGSRREEDVVKDFANDKSDQGDTVLEDRGNLQDVCSSKVDSCSGGAIPEIVDDSTKHSTLIGSIETDANRQSSSIDDVTVLHYDGHASIAYGVDSCCSNPKYVVTCSFYDHLIHLSVLE